MLRVADAVVVLCFFSTFFSSEFCHRGQVLFWWPKFWLLCHLLTSVIDKPMTMTRSPMTRDKPQQQQGRPQDQQQDQPSLASLRASRKAYSSIGFGMSRQSKRRKNIKCWASAVFHLKLFFFPTFCVCPPAPNGDDLGITPPPFFFSSSHLLSWHYSRAPSQ